MTNAGFKGDNVHIASMTIESTSLKGAVLKFRALFEDKDGNVHAQVNHEIAISAEPNEFQAPVALLLEACRGFVARTHFDTPENLDTKAKTRRGIAEALSGSSDTSDEPGEQD